MPMPDALILGLILVLFAVFGIVLAGTCFYCRTGTDRPRPHREQTRGDAYPKIRA